jgi:hypothetical protein
MLPTARADNDMFAAQSRSSTPDYQQFLNLADDSTVANVGPLFSLAGVYGLTSLNDTIYAAEYESSSASYLATVPHDMSLFGQGARVSASPIGFPDVESLAAGDGVLYGTSLDYSAHRSTLITINPTTGIGSAIGVGAFDVLLVGLAFDPMADVLYGAGIPFGATGVDTPNLYTVNRSTGGTTLVGDLGVGLQSLAWDAELGLIGAFDKLYQINTTTGAASQIGSTDFTNGLPGTFNGIYGLAAIVTETPVPGDYNGDGNVNAADYTTWRNALGQMITLQNEGAGVTPGEVTYEDYDFWKTNYGNPMGLGSGVATIPEPATIWLLLGVIAIGPFLRSKAAPAR